MTEAEAKSALPTMFLFTYYSLSKNYKIMKALLFDIDRYDRSDLNKMNENELYGLAMSGDLYTTQVLSLDELQERINDDAIEFQNHWVYFIH